MPGQVYFANRNLVFLQEAHSARRTLMDWMAANQQSKSYTGTDIIQNSFNSEPFKSAPSIGFLKARMVRDNRYSPAIAMLRKLFKALYSAETGLDGYMKVNRWYRRQGKSIVVACMPKSGSTFLTMVIEEITGFERAHLTYAFERNEQELYLPKLIDSYAKDTVTQQHIRATRPNLDLMNRFGIRPVILVRNIYDSVVSIRDYLLREGVENFPSLYATENFKQLTEQNQYDFLIANAIPWYFNFFASWSDFCSAGQIDAIWAKYDDLILDWPAGIQKILAFYGLDKSQDEIAAAIERIAQDRTGTRFNKGVSGRGLEKLNEEQKAAISHFADFYPWIDFSAIGVLPNQDN